MNRLDFLPVSAADCAARGWDQLDFLIVCGDAYVDHPSFGPAILGRLLEAEGFRVGLIAQPSVDHPSDVMAMGRPRLAVLVASGVVDSMVDNYTAARRPRTDDRYSAGGQGGRRPDRATIRYCNMVRDQMGDIPLIIGGIEASLRRMAHYDYWDHKVRRSILQDSQADLLVYGMGELTLLEIARLLDRGVPVSSLNSLRGTCSLVREDQLPKKTAAFLEQPGFGDWFWRPCDADSLPDDLDQLFPADSQYVLLPDYETVSTDKTAYALAFRMLYLEQDPQHGRTLIQPHGHRLLIQNPPQRPLRTEEMDRVYDLPYTRRPHPVYDASGGVPAIAEVGMSIVSHRGCYGGCHFCAIALHQGRIIQYRSEASVVREAERIIGQPDFKGYIHDVGGPTANFARPACARQRGGGVCRNRQCLFPEPCPALEADHRPYMDLLNRIRQLDKVKRVFVRSGVRFDYLLLDQENDFLDQLCRYHVSGQLKVAPEHYSRQALAAMGKPPPEVYERFSRLFTEKNIELDKKQYLVPYLISGHPGCTLDDAIEMAQVIHRGQVIPEQVQDFYPTPGTLSTTMYHTGLDPLTMKPIHVVKGEEKTMQRALLQYRYAKNRPLVAKALRMAGRTDLIGTGPDALIPPSGQGSRKPAGSSRINGTDKGEINDGNHHQRKRTGRGHAPSDRRTGSAHHGGKRRPAGSGRHPGR